MSTTDIIVKTEDYFSIDHRVRLLTVETNDPVEARYFAILRDGKIEYTSLLFYGGNKVDIIRNCDAALEVVRKLLTETNFLVERVVGT